LSLLQDADPDLFNNPDINYARTCQASSFHQPVVVTKEEHDKLIADGYGDAIDNAVTYGSTPDKQNVYFCPRIWCPVSKTPITHDMYVKNGNKCPNGEEAKLMYEHPYWNNSADTKHYVGFHKKKTTKGLCLPCCYVKPLSKEKENECINPATSVKTKSSRSSKKSDANGSKSADGPAKDVYIMTQVPPLPDGRSGNIPQVLHEIITPNVTFSLCTKTLSSQECPLRRGITHKEDSIMNALVHAMGKSSKAELINLIKEHLDPLTFLSLENGHIVAAFTEPHGIVAREHPGLVKEMLGRLKKFPKYVDMFGLKHIENDALKMSRELQLYMAWLKYIKYLTSDEVKSPHHLYDLFHKMGYLLVVWDKEGNNEVQLRCPLYTSTATLVKTIGEHRKTIMLLHENGYYEPIELRKRTNNGSSIIDTKHTSTIDDVMDACGTSNDAEEDMVRRLVTINEWTKDVLVDGSHLLFVAAVVSPDLRVSHLLTLSHVVVIINGGLSIGYLPKLIHECNIKRVFYQEDVAGMVMRVRVLRQDMEVFGRKLRSVGLGFDMGVIQPNIQDAMHYNAVVQLKHPVVPPTIVIRSHDALREFEREEVKTQTQWLQLQRMIGKMFIQHYDTLVTPTLHKDRKERIDILSNSFPAFPDKKKLRAALEEMPLEHGKDVLLSWVQLLGYDDKYPFFQDKVQTRGTEWVFSQRVVEEGLPNEIVDPVKTNGARPLRIAEGHKKEYTPPSAVANTIPLPMMLRSDSVVKRKLPSKWTQIKNYEWRNFDVLHLSGEEAYTTEVVKELFAWIARKVSVPIQWGDIVYLKTKYVSNALLDKPSMLMLLEDPSMSHEWAQYFGKSFRQPKQIWERGFTTTPHNEIKDLWMTIAKSGKLWPADLDFYVASKLMDVTIIILHRSKYGGAAAAKRGEIEDLVASSSLYTRSYKMGDIQKKPICIFYKDLEKDRAVYSAITDQKGVFMFSSLFDCPPDIKKLIEHHVHTHTERH
jgi:hypothetical protein